MHENACQKSVSLEKQIILFLEASGLSCLLDHLSSFAVNGTILINFLKTKTNLEVYQENIEKNLLQ